MMCANEIVLHARKQSLVRVIGTGRSGTKFMSRILDLGHERGNTRGISSCRRDHVESDPKFWNVTIHAVRHPVHCISSLTTIRDSSWEEFFGWVKPDTDRSETETLDLAIAHYLIRNLLCETITSNRLRIEDLANANDNAREHHNYTSKQIFLRPLGPEALNLGKRYGYKLKF